MNNKYYTYAYLRKNRTPYYIGKGEGNRAYVRRQRRVLPPTDKNRIIFLKQNLTEEEAFKHEKYMIAVFGRKDLGTGILHNRTDGGEGVSGAIYTEEARRKISDAAKKRVWTEEQRKKASERNKKMGTWCGEKNPGAKKKGKKLEVPFSEKHKKNLSEAHKGNQNRKGHKHSEETKQKIREKALKKSYIVTHPDGREESVHNIAQFAREYNLSKQSICKVCKGKTSHTKGYKFSYANFVISKQW